MSAGAWFCLAGGLLAVVAIYLPGSLTPLIAFDAAVLLWGIGLGMQVAR